MPQPILWKLKENGRSRASAGLRLGVGPTVTGVQPMGTALPCKLVGVTRDSTGAIVGSATVRVFRTDNNQYVGEVLSDPDTGVYEFGVLPLDTYYVVAYKAGSPDLAGTTLNTLTGL